MRYIVWIMLILGLVSCGDDGDEVIFNYDGNNATAPTLPSGFYEFSIRLPSQLTRNVIGQSIGEVSFYLYELPDQAVVSISEDDNGQPGAVLFSQQLTGLRRNSWNDVEINEAFAITGNTIWVGIQVRINDIRQTIGCDAGPANPNGDWLYDESDQQWLTFRERVGDSINWNIRVKVR